MCRSDPIWLQKLRGIKLGLFKKKDITTLEMEKLIEKQKDSEQKGRLFLLTIQALLFFLKEFSLDLKEIDSDRFKEEVDLLNEIFLSDKKVKKINSLFEKQKINILQYIKTHKKYILDREFELKDIIELLTKAIATIDVENRNFNQSVYKQSKKIEKITLLDDIKKIKIALKQEIEQMNKTVLQKELYDKKQLERLSSKVSSLEVALKKAKKESLTDGLTGIYNRKAFDEYLKNLVEQNAVFHSPFSMLMLDIDDFKKINDTYGHQIGDRIILAMVQKCEQFIRKVDYFSRYGGEEFVIILTGASLKNGLKKARQICKSIAQAQYSIDNAHDIARQGGTELSFTVSIGVSAYQKGDTEATVTERADKALYLAKRGGKNAVASI